MRFGVGLACMLAVAIAGRTSTIFHLGRVVEIVADRCFDGGYV